VLAVLDTEGLVELVPDLVQQPTLAAEVGPDT
jgi:hypothetical protein